MATEPPDRAKKVKKIADQGDDNPLPVSGPRGGRSRKSMGKVNDLTIRLTEKEQRAIDLRRAGMTYENIAKALGYQNAQSASVSIRNALQKSVREPADALRQLEMDRLDNLFQIANTALVKSVQNSGGVAPDWAAWDRTLRLIESRARLLGIDMGTSINVNIETNGADATIVADGDTKSYIEALARIRQAEQDKKDEELKAIEATNNIVDAEIIDDDEGEEDGQEDGEDDSDE